MLKRILTILSLLVSFSAIAQPGDRADPVPGEDSDLVALLFHEFVKAIPERQVSSVTIDRVDGNTYYLVGGGCLVSFLVVEDSLGALNAHLVDAICSSTGFSVGN